jgi:serine protease AprX
LAPDLEALALVANGAGQVDVIVSYHQPATPSARARLRGRAEGATRELRVARALAARVSVSSLRLLAEDPEVESVSLDETIRVATDVATTSVGARSARASLNLDGGGVRVAVLDSGVAPVAGLGVSEGSPNGRIAAWVDLVDPHPRGPTDPYGHGTHVAGIIAGDEVEMHDPGAPAVLYGGVAPGAEIVSVRVLDRSGEGRTSDLIAGIDWVVDHADALGIRVMNLSLGHPIREAATTDPLVRACDRAWESGILVVVSAGNLGRDATGYGTITSPGNSARALTVGALVDENTASRSDDLPATYSSRGPTRFDGIVKPDLLAPGDDLVSLRAPHSTLDRQFPDNRVGSRSRGAAEAEYFRLSGTSMSAAMVSGAAALLFAADPALTPDTVKARLMLAAEKRSEDIFIRGAGALDVPAAIEATETAARAISPGVKPPGAEVVVGGLEQWGDDWGSSAVYGPPALWREETVWDLLSSPEEPANQTQPVLWQVPLPDPAHAPLVWDRIGLPRAQSVVWQRGSGGRAESVVWQIGGPLASQSVVWQLDGALAAESVVWQARGTTGADGTVSASSVVWQATDDGSQILHFGDSRAPR